MILTRCIFLYYLDVDELCLGGAAGVANKSQGIDCLNGAKLAGLTNTLHMFLGDSGVKVCAQISEIAMDQVEAFQAQTKGGRHSRIRTRHPFDCYHTDEIGFIKNCNQNSLLSTILWSINV